jgi:hypothetical protein
MKMEMMESLLELEEACFLPRNLEILRLLA